MTGSDAGKPHIVISKDTTLRVNLGLLVTAYIGAALGGWWFYELRQIDRSRMGEIETRLERRVDTISSDLNYLSKSATGQFSRLDRIADSVQVLGLLSHRLEQNEHANVTQERRMALHENKFEDLQRRTAEHSIVIDYIMRWLNPPGEQKKRGGYPFGKYQIKPETSAEKP